MRAIRRLKCAGRGRGRRQSDGASHYMRVATDSRCARTRGGRAHAAFRKLGMCAAAVCALSIAGAAEPPPLKEGLWEVHGQSVENPGNKKTDFTYRLCRNQAYDKAMDERVKNMKECTTSFESLGDGRFVSASRCTLGATVIESKGTYTYESSISTRSESFAKYDPPYHGTTDQSMVQDQRYVGACPAGMQPGDRIMANGALQHYGQ